MRQRVASIPRLDKQIEEKDQRLLDLVDSRDRFFEKGRVVSEAMIKGGIALAVAGWAASNYLGLGQTVAMGAVFGGIGLATLSIPVNMARSVMLEVRRGQLQTTASEKLSLLQQRQQLDALANYEKMYSETENLVTTLSKPGGGSIGRMGDSMYFNGIRVKSARRS